MNVLAAKDEVLRLRDYGEKPSGGPLDLDSTRNFRVLAHDAATLGKVIKSGRVDCIFTDGDGLRYDSATKPSPRCVRRGNRQIAWDVTHFVNCQLTIIPLDCSVGY